MRLKSSLAAMMSVVLISGTMPLSVLAAENDDNPDKGKYDEKDETIYGSLDASGALDSMYVVNTFDITEPGEIVDYGNYKNVRNLSNLNDIKQNNNEVHLQAEKDDDEFYYQGNMPEKSLPWDIEITYILDGEEVNPDELAGKSGDLELQIETSSNEDANQIFYKNYMLQISLTLGSDVFEDIQAPDGTMAVSGKDTQVTFTVMPEKEKTLIVSANVSDFEMDPIDISATPASMPIDDPELDDVKSDMSSLSDAVRDIDDGVGDLKSGIADLNSGASDLRSGSSDYLNGLNELDQKSGELVSGSADIRDAIQKLNGSLADASGGGPDLSEMKALPGGLRDMASGLRDSADGLNKLKKNYNKAYDQLDNAMNQIPEPDEKIKDKIAKLYKKAPEQKETIDKLSETYKAAQKAKGTYHAVEEAFSAVGGTIDQTVKPLNKMADNMESTADKIESSMNDMDQLDALDELQNGLSSLASEYKTFHNGLVEYTDGVSQLKTNYKDINSGIQDLADGTSDLNNGASDLKDGTEELRGETSSLPEEMQDEVDEMLDEYDASDFEPESFVSDKNDKIDVVQFTLSTDAIELDEEDEENKNDEESEKGFWGRLMDLFK